MAGTASVSELGRRTQLKEKPEGRDGVSGGRFTYPALIAAGSPLDDPGQRPVGDDQRQHVEVTRDLAERFNARDGPTFTVPEAAIATVGARVMDLQDPRRKMSKSELSPAGVILLLDDPADIERKIKRAVT